jgi:hypothetical protein
MSVDFEALGADAPAAADHERIARWMRNDVLATDFLLTLFAASHWADDIVDGDSADPCADMARVWMAFFGRLMPNPFYLMHAERFAGAIVPAVCDWRLATAWEGDSDTVKRVFALVLRTTLEHAAIVAADLVGGADHAAAVARELREIYHMGEGREDIADWLKECEARHGLAG